MKAKVQDKPESPADVGDQILSSEKKVFLRCGACGGTAFKYDKSKSTGLIGLECENEGC